MPPARDIDGALTRARKVPILDLHAFTSASANAEAAPPSSNLPPPEKWVLLRMGEVRVTEMLERHIDSSMSMTGRCICRRNSSATSCDEDAALRLVAM
jgi:hypothetical protein